MYLMTFEPCPALKLNVVLMGRISVDPKKGKKKRKEKKKDLRKTLQKFAKVIVKTMGKLSDHC